MTDLTKDQKILCQANCINPYSIEIYLDWVNNYVSYKTMALDYGIAPEKMDDIIADSRNEYQQYCTLVQILENIPF